MTSGLLDALRRMTCPDIGLGAAAIAGVEGLFPEEAPAIANAVWKRQSEFAAGRRAARAALAEIGCPASALPVGADRAPVWPEGIVGSITHDGGMALAVAAFSRHVLAVGIDVTEAEALPEGVREQVLRHPGESGLDDLAARAAFSAKETIFKVLSPRVGQVFGFSAVVVRPDLAAGTFDARLLHALGPFAEGSTWTGRIAVEGDLLITALVLRSGEDLRVRPWPLN